MGYWDFESLEVSKPKYQNISVSSPEPTNEPISLTLAKNYLKVDYTTDDDLIEFLIKSVRKQIENELGGLHIVKRAVTQKQTGGIERIKFMREPVNSITSITYFEEFDSTGEVLSASNYRFVDGEIYHRDGFWKVGRESDGYVIVYNAGIVDDTGQAAENSAPALRNAMLRIIGYLYENREEFATTIGEGNLNISYNTIVGNSELKSLLMPYMTVKAVF